MYFRKLPPKNLLIIVLLSAAALGFGCAQQNIPQTNTNTAPTNSANTTANTQMPTNSAPQARGNTNRLPVTLPVLDAMLYDENFTNALKSEAGLTDEEIEKLKKASGEAVAELGESDENTGSTRNAVRRAETKIREMFGNEKAEKIFALVASRWNSGEINPETALNAKPNAIPTDTRIVVNAPAYRMDVFQDGKLVKTYKIGIGYPEFPLPEGLRKADTIIFNPTWTPPDEPWVKGQFKPYQKVEAGSKLNPLGVVKIPIGLPSLIHGGKQPARLGNFASHGCVGLTNAQVQDFSLTLAQISGTELTQEDVSGYAKERGETKNVELAKTIPVELRYETIVVENGKLKIYRDVYEHGTNTEENLRKVLDSYGVSFDGLTEPERQNILNALNAMNTDAEGKPITENAQNAANKDESANANSNSDSAKDKDKEKESSKVTRNIKGQKEIEIVIAQLNGKGYPAPVNFNAGK